MLLRSRLKHSFANPLQFAQVCSRDIPSKLFFSFAGRWALFDCCSILTAEGPRPHFSPVKFHKTRTLTITLRWLRTATWTVRSRIIFSERKRRWLAENLTQIGTSALSYSPAESSLLPSCLHALSKDCLNEPAPLGDVERPMAIGIWITLAVHLC